MAKNIIQDIIVKNKRSIRQIPVSGARNFPRTETIKRERKDYNEDEEEQIPMRGEKRVNGDGNKIQKIIIWAIAIFSVIILLYAISSYFSTATVIITPKSESVTLDDAFIAKKEALDGALRYELMTLQKKNSKQLEATETINSKTKASGKIVVYNNFGSATQKLIKNTRLESSNGMIYKIPESITVPGKKTVGGKSIPGSVETLIFADEPGEKYNLKISELKGDFKVAGFKGDKKYDFFYGRAKTDIDGGSSGVIKKVPAKLVLQTRSDLRASLKEELLKEALASKPESSMLFDDGFFIDYVTLSDTDLGGDKVDINESATFYGIIFDKAKLASYLAKQKISDYDGAPVDLILDKDIKVGISSNSKSKPWEGDAFSISFKGKADFIWIYDKAALQKKSAGQNKNDLNKILSLDFGIKEAKGVIRPIWKRTLPSDPKKIKIESSLSGK
ncbi:MAG: hypothetical protein AAB736_00065 [Patescibacteria group bacterium]